MTGGDGNDLFEGGSGFDTIVDTADADMVLNVPTLVIGTHGAVLRHRVGGPDRGRSDNTLDASAFNGPVILIGGAGNDTLIGGPQGDQLQGGVGNDSFIAGAGPT